MSDSKGKTPNLVQAEFIFADTIHKSVVRFFDWSGKLAVLAVMGEAILVLQKYQLEQLNVIKDEKEKEMCKLLVKELM